MTHWLWRLHTICLSALRRCGQELSRVLNTERRVLHREFSESKKTYSTSRLFRQNLYSTAFVTTVIASCSQFQGDLLMLSNFRTQGTHFTVYRTQPGVFFPEWVCIRDGK